jgi:hypothetical protein
MTTLRRITLTIGLTVMASGLASAGTIFGNCSPSINAPTELNNTPVTCGAVTLPGGAVLSDIIITIDSEITGAIALTNNAATSQTAKGTTDSAVFLETTLTGFSGLTAGTLLDDPSFTTGFETLTAGQTITSSGLDSGVFATGPITNTTNLNAYLAGLTADFTTITGFAISGGGGHIASGQTTSADVGITLQYDYTIPSGTPEPTTFVLFGSALVGLGLIRKRVTR